MHAHPELKPESIKASAANTFTIEIQALKDLSSRLDDSFTQAIELILTCPGRVVVTGIGKSGHIARKIAATLASTGTPAFFMHAAEAIHGDLGMLTGKDILLGISYSGSAQELITIISVAKRMGTGIIAITGNMTSELANNADIALDASVSQEACPLNLAPTASTTAALALGDAMAIACLEARGFNQQDFARSHPGGALGRRLLTSVADIMRSGTDLPKVTADTLIPAALVEMSQKGMGMTIVMQDSQPIGIFTDGDLRRVIAQYGDIRALVVTTGMSRNPKSISPTAAAIEAASIMDAQKLNQMLVIDHQGKLVGALHMHDLLAAKVI